MEFRPVYHQEPLKKEAAGEDALQPGAFAEPETGGGFSALFKGRVEEREVEHDPDALAFFLRSIARG